MSEKLRAEWFWTDRWFSSSACCLPIDARGLYRELLTRAWSMGAQLPTNVGMLMRIAGVTQDEWDRCWPMVKGYWVERDGHLVNATQVEVYADAQRRQQVRTDRAKKGAQARWGASSKQCSSNAQASAKQCPPSPSPSPSKTQTPNAGNDNGSCPPASPPSECRAGTMTGFDTFWMVYPKKRKKGDAEKAWVQKRCSDIVSEIIDAIRLAVQTHDWRKDSGTYIPYPATWLRAKGWADEYHVDIEDGPHLSEASRRSVEAAASWLRRQEPMDE